jgi:hypothetical protein
MSHVHPRQWLAYSRLVSDPPTGEMTALMEETAEWAMELSKMLNPVAMQGRAPRQEKTLCCSYLSRCCKLVGVAEKREQVQVCWSLKE